MYKVGDTMENIKAKLKTGMVVEYRNGSRMLVFEDRLLGNEKYGRLNEF